MKTLALVLLLALLSIPVFAQDIEETKGDSNKKLCGFIREMNYVANTQFNLCKNLKIASGKDPSTFTYQEINQYAFQNSLDLTNPVDAKACGVANGIIDKCVNGLNQLNVLRSEFPTCK